MFRLLTQRLFPPSPVTQFCIDRTNRGFVNQASYLLTQTISDIEDRNTDSFDHGRLFGQICRRYLYLNKERVDHGKRYDEDDFRMLLDRNRDLAFLDLVDVACHFIHQNRRYLKLGYFEFTEEMNRVLRDNGLGYRLSDGLLVRTDSETEFEMVSPVRKALSDAGYDTAERLFADALAHFRIGEDPEASGCAVRALDSAMGTFGGGIPEEVSRTSETVHSMLEGKDASDAESKYILDLTASAILFLMRSAEPVKAMNPMQSQLKEAGRCRQSSSLRKADSS